PGVRARARRRRGRRRGEGVLDSRRRLLRVRRAATRTRPEAGHVKPTVWRDAVRDSELDWLAKAALMTLSTFMNGRAEAWPSKEALATGSGLSKRAVDDAIKRAEQAGYLSVSRTRGRSSNRYLGTVPNPAPDARSTLQELHGSTLRNPAGDDSQPC